MSRDARLQTIEDVAAIVSFAVGDREVVDLRTLEAEVKREKEASKDERVLHSERVYGKVVRSFTLPQELDESKAEAKFKDGVLELTLPKKAAAQRKQISIQ